MDGNPSDFTTTRLSGPASRRVLKWLILVAAGLFAVSVVIFFFGNSSFSESGVDLKITGSSQASVGDEVVYKVNYTNKTKTALNNLLLTFTYPDGAVILKDGQVVNNPSRVETINELRLNPGQSEEKEFHMFLVGDKGNIKTAKVKLEFDAGSLKSSFEKDAEAATTITDVPVSLTLSASPNTVSGDTVSYVLDYRNQSGDQISDLQAVFTLPDGFSVKRTSPAAAQGTTWTIKTLKPGDGGRITIDGTLSGTQNQNKTISVTLQRSINGTYIDYEKASATTVIASPLLNVSMTANSGTDYISHVDDTLQYRVDYQNTSNFTFSGLIMTVKLDGNMYDLSSVDPKGGYFDSSNNTITWNSSAVSNFDNLRPNQNGSVTFAVRLKPNLTGSGSSSYFVHATATLATQNVPSGVDGNTVSAQADLVTKITSQPTLRQQLYYNDAAFGQTGPVPPVVNQETAYTVHWKITNPGNALSNAKIVATLPTGVTWKNVISVSAGQSQPTYSKTSGQVIWNLGSVPAGAGVSGAAYDLAFQVSIKPSTSQAGQNVTLVKAPTLSGVDSFTQQNFVVTGLDLTTSDTVDQPGQGTVQSQ